MSISTMILLVGAGAGALVLMHAFARTKEASELMLATYEEMLAESRRKKREAADQKARLAAEQADDDMAAVLPANADPADLMPPPE